MFFCFKNCILITEIHKLFGATIMNFYKGDIASLYCEFKVDNASVVVENPQIRILHEKDDNIYEDLEWQDMIPYENGYRYAFDTNICSDGTYVAVYKGIYNGQTLNVVDEFNVITQNIEEQGQITIYGYVNDLNTEMLIPWVSIKITDMINGATVYTGRCDADGKWKAQISPGDYTFSFSKKHYLERTIRAQVGDEHSEVQFNNVALENESDATLGNGLYKIEDQFTKKNNQGIEGIAISIYSITDTENAIITTTTNKRGRWKAFLDDGNYIMKIVLPSGTKKSFKLNVYNNGKKTMEEFTTQQTVIGQEQVGNGTGENLISDYVIDAHGKGLPNIIIRANKYNPDTDDYALECETTTEADGHFELHLHNGKYKLIVSGAGFKTTESKVTIGDET